MEHQIQVPVQPGELELIQARSAAQFALTPVGLQVKQFEVQQRMAKMYATSTIVPKSYQDNLGNCVIAIDMAMRMQANPLMVMQNLYIVNGNPSFSSKFLIATINASGRFTPIRYEFRGEEGKDDYACRVYAYEISDTEHKEPLYGDWVSILMAKKEGWFSKKDRNGNETSKWQTMPSQMMRYRAAAFWQRVYCPEISMGLMTKEEYEDIDEQQQPVYSTIRSEIVKEANNETLNIEDEAADAKPDNEEKTAGEATAQQHKNVPSEEKPLEPSGTIPEFMK